MLFSLVFAKHRLRQNRPRLFRIAEDSPLFSGLQHLTSCLSASYALFSLTAIFQPFSFQSLPHSFHRDGGCTPSLLSSKLGSSDLRTVQRVSELFPVFSNSCALFCTFLHSRKTQPFYFQALPH